jgi:hypothetical protein
MQYLKVSINPDMPITQWKIILERWTKGMPVLKFDEQKYWKQVIKILEKYQEY